MTRIKKYWQLALGATLGLPTLLAIMLVFGYTDVDISQLSTSIIKTDTSTGKAVYTHELTIILDAAHGSDVAGKASPDGEHREYQWSRMFIKVLGERLTDMGYNVVYTVSDETEPGLTERVRRMNAVNDPAIVLSLHNNAAGSGQWKEAHGYSFWTTPGFTRSDICADILFRSMRTYLPELTYRTDYSDKDSDYEAKFTVLYSKHPTVLMEYLFQDNHFDVQLILNVRLSNTTMQVLAVSMLQIEHYLCNQPIK